MKKGGILILTALLMLAAGCGGQRDGEGGAEEAEVSLSALYAGMAEACGWEEDYMTSVDGGLLEEYYPGLSGLSGKQLIAQVPAMSSDVNEIVLFQGETEEDGEKAAEILQARIDGQVEGGAWYPETLESWKSAKVLRQGAYAALIASGTHQEELEELFSFQFQSDEG